MRESESEVATRDPAPGLLAYCTTPSNLRRAVRTALIVGPILTLINQTTVVGDLFALRPVPSATFLRIALTFVVPFLVSLVSSAAADRARRSVA